MNSFSFKKFFSVKDRGPDKIKIQIHDKLKLDSTRQITPEGYLKATAAITKVGVQQYKASEFGLGPDDMILNIFRPPETVFHPKTIKSIKLKPITSFHPDEDVNSSNHNRYSVGVVGENVEPIDEETLGANIEIKDKQAVQDIIDRKIDQLSLGYDSFIVSEKGEYKGESYDYKWDGPMFNNHLAIVDSARCGDTVKILDEGENEMFKKLTAVKFMKDRGIAQSVIDAFMRGKSDDADADLIAFGKALMTKKPASGKDMDMEGLIPALVVELMPKMEEMIASPDFMGMVAKEVAASMSPAAPESDLDAEMEIDPNAIDVDPNETLDAEDPDKKKEAEDGCKKDASILAKAKKDMHAKALRDHTAKRIQLITDASPYMDEGTNIHSMTDHDIMVHACEKLGVTDAKNQKVDYLRGILASAAKDRKDAETSLNNGVSVGDSSKPGFVSAPISGLQARKLQVVKS